MAEPALALTRLAGSSDSPSILVVGSSLGTSVEALWSEAARLLGRRFEVIGWDLPGHGHSEATAVAFSIAGLAAAVRGAVEPHLAGRGASYAGVSLGGAVALELALDPGPFSSVASVASAAKIGEPAAWHDRAALVREAGTPVMVAGSSERWFAPGFLERDPATGNRLLLSLSETDRESYALACEALAAHDLRSRIADARLPVLMAAGDLDGVVPPDLARATADLVPGAGVHVFTGCAHLPPAEDPAAVAATLTTWIDQGATT
jgi:3-oxoadipate enol-lactonase